MIQAVEGEYWNEDNSENVKIKNIGDGKLLVTTTLIMFSYEENIAATKIYDVNLFFYGVDREDLSVDYTLRFNKDKELVLKYNLFQSFYSGNEITESKEIHETYPFIKK